MENELDCNLKLSANYLFTKAPLQSNNHVAFVCKLISSCLFFPITGSVKILNLQELTEHTIVMHIQIQTPPLGS